jgi:hypothetical protein
MPAVYLSLYIASSQYTSHYCSTTLLATLKIKCIQLTHTHTKGIPLVIHTQTRNIWHLTSDGTNKLFLTKSRINDQEGKK